jgi:GAF domain-containing protein
MATRSAAAAESRPSRIGLITLDAKQAGERSYVGSEGALARTITLAKRARGHFTDKRAELITTFADQAVIAAENTRLFEEV